MIMRAIRMIVIMTAKKEEKDKDNDTKIDMINTKKSFTIIIISIITMCYYYSLQKNFQR